MVAFGIRLSKVDTCWLIFDASLCKYLIVGCKLVISVFLRCLNLDLVLALTTVLISMSTLTSLVNSPGVSPPHLMMLPPLFQLSIISGERMIATPPFAPWFGWDLGPW